MAQGDQPVLRQDEAGIGEMGDLAFHAVDETGGEEQRAVLDIEPAGGLDVAQFVAARQIDARRRFHRRNLLVGGIEQIVPANVAGGAKLAVTGQIDGGAGLVVEKEHACTQPAGVSLPPWQIQQRGRQMVGLAGEADDCDQFAILASVMPLARAAAVWEWMQ